MGRHVTRIHDGLNTFSPNSTMAHQISFKAQKSDHQKSSIVQSWLPLFMPDLFTNGHKDPLWLQALRMLAEMKRLFNELSLASVSQPFISSYKVGIDRCDVRPPQDKLNDLEIVGYAAYICKDCLISLPLTVYWDNINKVMRFAIHKCNDERVIEVRQTIRNKDDIIATLPDELPDLMFQVVMKWTKGAPVLQVAEIYPATAGPQNFIPIDKKEWAIRAIRNTSTPLAHEELAKFLSLARYNTYACFRRADTNKTYQMYVAAASAVTARQD